MMQMFYYIFNTLLLAVLAAIIGFEYAYGRNIKEPNLQFRRKGFLCFFSVFFIASLSELINVNCERMEMLPTLTICLHYCAFVTFSLLTSAYFGKQSYRNVFTWLFLLQYPIVLIFFNIYTRITHKYQPLYQIEDARMPDNPIGKVIFLGRIVWLLIILIVYISLFMVMLNSYLQARKRRKKREYSLDTVQNSSEHRNILYYIIVMVFTMLSCIIRKTKCS